MKRSCINVRLSDNLLGLLDEVRQDSGQTRSEIMREALRRHLALRRFEGLRRQIVPYAEARGFLTDEDVFKVVS
jgi:metal-responsive CopG/Arc/MetJ family transcriptional regulator